MIGVLSPQRSMKESVGRNPNRVRGKSQPGILANFKAFACLGILSSNAAGGIAPKRRLSEKHGGSAAIPVPIRWSIS
jgi:hypothetical protein